MATIPNSRQIHPAFFVARSDGTTFVDLTDYISNLSIELGTIDEVGTESGGADSGVRKMDFTVRNDRVFIPAWPDDTAREETDVVGDETDVVGDELDGGEVFFNLLFDTDNALHGSSFAPRDRESEYNLVSGSYAPLLWPNRAVVFRVGIEGTQESGTTTILDEEVGTGDASETTFSLDKGPVVVSASDATLLKGTVYLDDVATTDYTVDPDAIPATITFASAPDTDVAITASYTWYQTLFEGYLGDNIRTTGPTVECSCRDKSKLLQDTFIETVREYGSDEGVAAETVIQSILDDNLDVGETPTLVTPSSPGFVITPYEVDYQSVHDAIQQVPTQHGWFVGYRLDATTNAFTLQYIEPPRDKAAASADFVLDYEDDFYRNDLDITDADVRNAVTVNYRDDATGDRATFTQTDATSIGEYRRKAMWIEEADVSLIDTEAEATALADAALADLKNPSATTRIDMPLLPQMDVFSGITIDDPRTSSTVDFFGVESVRHSLDFGAGRFRTEVIAGGSVVGGHQKWLAMQARPGGRKPISQQQATRSTIGAPRNLAVDDDGTENIGQDTLSYAVLGWDAPAAYDAKRYRLQIRRDSEGTWANAQEFEVGGTSQKFTGPGNVAYDARVAVIPFESANTTWSSTLEFTAPGDTTAPATPSFSSLTSYIRALDIDQFAANTEADFDHYNYYANDSGSALDSGTASFGSTSALQDSSKSWTEDEFVDDYILITGGTGAGQARKIVHNTSTTAYAFFEDEGHVFSTAPDNTSTYLIMPAESLRHETDDTSPLIKSLTNGTSYYVWVEAEDTSGNVSVATDWVSEAAGRVGNDDISTTSDIARMFTAGRITMPGKLDGDLKYGYDISLPTTLDFDDISVVMSFMGWDEQPVVAWDGTEKKAKINLVSLAASTGDLTNGGTSIETGLSDIDTGHVGALLVVDPGGADEEMAWVDDVTSSGGSRVYHIGGGKTWDAPTGTYDIEVHRGLYIAQSTSEDATFDVWTPDLSIDQWVSSVIPFARWNKRGASSGDEIRIFSGVEYLVAYRSTSSASTVMTRLYALGGRKSGGVNEVDQHIGIRGSW